jgi:hypothetical protein
MVAEYFKDWVELLDQSSAPMLKESEELAMAEFKLFG